MLYAKSQTLDLNNATHIRMQKMEEQRQLTVELRAGLAKYTAALTNLAQLEKHIAELVFRLYTTESVCSDLLHTLSKAIAYKSEVACKSAATLAEQLDKSSKLEGLYEPLRPLFKNYATCEDALAHYTHKLPKVIEAAEAKRKSKGQLSAREAEKLVRNKRKLDTAAAQAKAACDVIADETNALNLSRFGHLNPLVRQFISAQLASVYVTGERWAGVKNFEDVLARQEPAQFNDRYFLDLQKKLRSRMMKDNAGLLDGGDKLALANANVQHNYFYVNNEQVRQISQFNVEEDGKEAKHGFRLFNKKDGGQQGLGVALGEEDPYGIDEGEFGGNLGVPVVFRGQ